MTIPGLPNPWLILGIVAAFITYGEVRAYKAREAVRMEWRAEANEANVAALKKQAELDTATAARDAAQAETTRNMEAEYREKLKAADAGRDAFAKRLRLAQTRLARCELSATSANPGRATGTSAGSDAGLRPTDFERTQRLRSVGKTLQETVKLCVAWARENGR